MAMAEASHDLRATEVALTALYLRGSPVQPLAERRRWVSLSSALLRRVATLETLGLVAQQEGFHEEAALLDSPGLLAWASALVESNEVLTAVSPGYPQRWVKVLSYGAPPALWKISAGPQGIGPGHPRPDGLPAAIAVVGSRKISRSVNRFANEVGALTAGHGMDLFSGNALGCDIAAMRGAANGGGRVIGILPHGIRHLQRRVKGAEYWSVCAPDEEFSTGTAMERNCLIYASSAFSVVVQSRLRAGGTWHGAIEAHRRKLTRLVAREDMLETGNRALIALGAIPIKSPNDLLSAFDREEVQPILFN